MFNVINSLDKPLNQVENFLDPQLWHACAGGMAQIPPLHSKVYYFPQGHAEHATEKNTDFSKLPKFPPIIPCKLLSIKYLADSDTDEVYVKIKLLPLCANESYFDDDNVFFECNKNEDKEKTNSFAKTLTQSDANNGGGFSVPRYCAETIFPKLDFSSEPPVQTILVKDAHGQIWKFRHIYRGTPRRHLLTTGWSNFVNSKKLVAGDSVVFLKAENGDLCVGIRRAKVGICGVLEKPHGNNGVSVIEAVSLAASGRAFEVIYYPRASAPEFVVKASAVRAAMRVQWCGGIRFKMAFETEDSSRISWFMGTVSSVGVDDPVSWPNSPWRILQVLWDEPDLLENVKRVNPWLIEVVSNIPHMYLSPRKRPRHQHSEFPVVQRLPPKHFINNPLSPISPLRCLWDNNMSSCIQGARHTRYVLSSSSNINFDNLPMVGPLRPFDFEPLDYSGPHPKTNNRSGITDFFPGVIKKNNEMKKPPVLVLFGKPILTEEQMISRRWCTDSDENRENLGNMSNGSGSGSGSAVIQTEASSEDEFPRFEDCCKVFLESEGVGRILDLSVVDSYEDLFGKLAEMFGVGRTEILSNVVYSDASGSSKRVGDEAFGDFRMKARRLEILVDTGSDNRGN